jgi:long-subunit acyl-CoA synthetase (AMP-forming)
MVADAGVELVLTTTAVSARAGAFSVLVPELLSAEWLNVDEVELSAPPSLVEDVASADDIAFLQYTSGSTSAPRGVIVTHANLLHNLAHSARLGQHDASSISVSWLPVNHDMA